MGFLQPLIEGTAAAAGTVAATAAAAAPEVASTAAAATPGLAATSGAATAALAPTASVLGAVTTAAKLATAGALLKTALSPPKVPKPPVPPGAPPGFGVVGQKAPAAELGGTSLVSSAFRPATSGGKTLLGQ